MSSEKIVISGTGCALADFLYNDISLDSQNFKKYQSEKAGDGGLSPGKLVFTEELEKFSDTPYASILSEITGNHSPNAFNVGGPSLVSLIHASQMLDFKEFEVKYFGTAGKDKISKKIFDIVRETPLNIDNYLTIGANVSPFTDVFSDPSYANGHGERTFVNNIGAAWDYIPECINEDFFESDIVCFGGTALVPHIHDNLTQLLARAKEKKCITLVNTVFDFRNEKEHPGSNWPLVDNCDSFGLIDILIMDCEEASKISGQKNIESSAGFFASTNVSSFIITNGPDNIYAKSNGGLFGKTEMIILPASQKVKSELKSSHTRKGDTTGCGDNFTGGIITSIANQLKSKSKGKFNFVEAISWGVASGGFTCFITGGTFIEKFPGEKLGLVADLQTEYLKQIEN